MSDQPTASNPPVDVPASGAVMSSDRLTAFRSEVESIKMGGKKAQLEGAGSIAGIAIVVVGIVVAIIGYSSAKNAGAIEEVHRNAILGTIGVVLAVVGALIWLRNSITRHLRWWMIRNIYEQREQTDRLIEAIREGRK